MSIETQYAIGCIMAVLVMGISILLSVPSWTDIEDEVLRIIEEELGDHNEAN